MKNCKSIITAENGTELIEILDVSEKDADKKYYPVTHALAIVRIGKDYLMGWNKWRNDWEIFGGCKENGESMRECIIRECEEELGIKGADVRFLGLAHYNMAPGYFNPEWHEEYGGLYGITLPVEALALIEENRQDKEEIGKLMLYSSITDKEDISVIDEKLLEFYR